MIRICPTILHHSERISRIVKNVLSSYLINKFINRHKTWIQLKWFHYVRRDCEELVAGDNGQLWLLRQQSLCENIWPHNTKINQSVSSTPESRSRGLKPASQVYLSCFKKVLIFFLKHRSKIMTSRNVETGERTGGVWNVRRSIRDAQCYPPLTVSVADRSCPRNEPAGA